MNFLKIIFVSIIRHKNNYFFYFFFLNIYSIGLFAGEVVSFSFKKENNIEIFNFFKNEGIINSFHEGENDSVSVEFSQDWIISFKNQRTKELELMLKEQKALQSILLENGIVRTSENIENIRLAFKSYEKTVPKREEEEKLSFVEFIFLYQNDLEALAEEIKNTRCRLSGISYSK